MYWVTPPRASAPAQQTAVRCSCARAQKGAADARKAGQDIQRGEYRGPLHGIPFGLKDIYDTADLLTSGGSAAFSGRSVGPRPRPHRDKGRYRCRRPR
ncbi:MAG: amidase family protein [Betaproteobacteria bacterium]